MDKQPGHQSQFLGVVFTLMDRGLTGEEIDRSMKLAIGHDWREVSVTTWFARLNDRNYVKDVPEDQYIDELEALIRGVIRLEQIGREV